MSEAVIERKITTVIFDFDGTIADSFNIFMETIDEVLRRPQPFSPDEIARFRGMSAREVIKKIGVKKWQIPNLIIKGRRAIARKMDRVQAFDGMPEAIIELSHKGYQCYLLSTNSKDAITGLLRRYGLEDSMADIYADTGIFGKAKRLSSLLKKHGLTAKQCVYVGDETRDIEAARAVGLNSVAVEWGYSTSEVLKSYKPDMLVANSANLVKAIESLSL
jgi:phosphoglycolate phosphatase